MSSDAVSRLASCVFSRPPSRSRDDPACFSRRAALLRFTARWCCCAARPLWPGASSSLSSRQEAWQATAFGGQACPKRTACSSLARPHSRRLPVPALTILRRSRTCARRPPVSSRMWSRRPAVQLLQIRPRYRARRPISRRHPLRPSLTRPPSVTPTLPARPRVRLPVGHRGIRPQCAGCRLTSECDRARSKAKGSWRCRRRLHRRARRHRQRPRDRYRCLFRGAGRFAVSPRMRASDAALPLM